MNQKPIFITEGTKHTWTTDEGEEVIERIDSKSREFTITESDTSIEIVAEKTGYRTGIVTVYKPRKWGGDCWKAAEINWSALGSQSVEIANLMISALQKATVYAQTLDILYGVEK